MPDSDRVMAPPVIDRGAVMGAARMLASDEDGPSSVPPREPGAVTTPSRHLEVAGVILVVLCELACLATDPNASFGGRFKRPLHAVDRAFRPFGTRVFTHARNDSLEKDHMRMQSASLNFAVASSMLLGGSAMAGDTLLYAWGSNTWGQTQLPANSSNIADIGAWIHGFGLRFDGTLVLWGSNGQGQAQSQGSTKFAQVATTGLHNVALTQAGAVQAWGYNNYGQINVPGSLGTVIAIGAGDYHSFAIKSDGSLVIWGRNDQGQCAAPPTLEPVHEINGGYWHSCAVTTGGRVRVWGGNINDFGSASNQSVLPASLSEARVSSARAGSFHNLAIRADGTVVAWGDNSRGQTDVPAGLAKVVQVSAGYLHSAALTQDGVVVCWGDNSKGACSVPQSMGRVIKVVAAYDYTAALATAENCVADLDGDGEVSGGDVSLLLLNWGPCPQ